jgi:hypothetical protein
MEEDSGFRHGCNASDTFNVEPIARPQTR